MISPAVILKYWRPLALVGAVAATFGAGAWTGREWQRGLYARAQAAQQAAWREALAKLRVSEAVRLAETADLRARLDEVTNEILADPAGAAPALGVSDAQRLNRIR